MRLKSDIWVQAYMRRCALEGAAAMLERRGDEDAGAIYIKIARLDGTACLFGPAPAGLDIEREDRRFVLITAPDAAESACDERLASERKFDSDLWIVTIEDRQGRHFLDDWLLPPQR